MVVMLDSKASLSRNGLAICGLIAVPRTIKTSVIMMIGLSHDGDAFHVLRFIDRLPVSNKNICEMNRYR